jgi:hypothetical protein
VRVDAGCLCVFVYECVYVHFCVCMSVCMRVCVSVLCMRVRKEIQYVFYLVCVSQGAPLS